MQARGLLERPRELAGRSPAARSPAGRFLASGGGDGVLITDAFREEPAFRLVDERSPAVTSIGWSPDGLSLATAGFDQAFGIRDVWR